MTVNRDEWLAAVKRHPKATQKDLVTAHYVLGDDPRVSEGVDVAGRIYRLQLLGFLRRIDGDGDTLDYELRIPLGVK